VRDNIPHSDNRRKSGREIAVWLFHQRFLAASPRISIPAHRANAQSVRGEAFLGLTTGKILNTASGQQHVQQISSDLDGIDGLCTTKDRFPLGSSFPWLQRSRSRVGPPSNRVALLARRSYRETRCHLSAWPERYHQITSLRFAVPSATEPKTSSLVIGCFLTKRQQSLAQLRHRRWKLFILPASLRVTDRMIAMKILTDFSPYSTRNCLGSWSSLSFIHVLLMREVSGPSFKLSRRSPAALDRVAY